MRWIEFTLNNELRGILVDPKRTLLDVVRNDFGLTGTKEGCQDGVCGSCTMLIDGRPVNTCVFPIERAEGKNIVTIEGLKMLENIKTIQNAFVHAGAVQCGYCTPGMVLNAMVILEKNPEPSREEVRKALSRNLCRCTGYQKIVDGVMLAAQYIKSPAAMEDAERKLSELTFGDHVPQMNSIKKTMGEFEYSIDKKVKNISHAKVLRSPYAHAKIISIDSSEAEKLNGVITVCTAKDIKGVNRVHLVARQNMRALADDRVRYLGEPIAIVVALTEEIAEQALKKIKVNYEPLKAFSNPFDALEPGAIEIDRDEFPGNIAWTQGLIKGEVSKGFEEADIVVENDYYTPANAHAYLEPDTAIGFFDEEDRLTIYSPGQGPHTHRDIIARLLGVEQHKVRVVEDKNGGGFGARIEPYIQVLAAIAVHKAGRTVRLQFSMEETFAGYSKRHPFYIKMKTGVSKDGKILAHDVVLVSDAGAYANMSRGVLMRAVVHSYGPFEIPNIRVDGKSILTNNTPSGAMRGFGVAQVTFALQMQLYKIASQLGLDVLELQKMNGFKAGSITATGQLLDEPNGYPEVIDAIRQHWRTCQKYTDPEQTKTLPPHIKRGVGFATYWYGIGKTGYVNTSNSIIEVLPDGNILVRCGAADLGQGVTTVAALIAAKEMEIPINRVKVIAADSLETPDAEVTSASRQTFYSGNATLGALKELKKEILKTASAVLSLDEKDLSYKNGWVYSNNSPDKKVSLFELVSKGYKLRSHYKYSVAWDELDKITGQGVLYSVFTYGASVVEVEVNTKTGEIKVLSVANSAQCGNAVNKLGIEGQIEGGVAMGIGFALQENYISGETKGFKQYSIPRAKDVPDITSYLVEVPQSRGPYGAIGLGESPHLPIAPAIMSAVHNACGIWVNELPLTQLKVLEALSKQ